MKNINKDRFVKIIEKWLNFQSSEISMPCDLYLYQRRTKENNILFHFMLNEISNVMYVTCSMARINHGMKRDMLISDRYITYNIPPKHIKFCDVIDEFPEGINIPYNNDISAIGLYNCVIENFQ